MPAPRSSPRLLRLGPVFLAAFFSLFVSLATLPAKAVEPDEVLQDQALEARARHISEGLRCLVCQNQSIDDSEAPLAKDLRLLVRERLKQGDSDQQVVDFIVARYGEFVLYRPGIEPGTWEAAAELAERTGVAVLAETVAVVAEAALEGRHSGRAGEGR